MDGPTPPNFSFPLNTPRGVDRSARAPQAHPAPSIAESLAAQRTDTVHLSSRTPSTTGAPSAGTSAKVSKLVAASVTVPVNFDAARPAPDAALGALPMYRHPADRNAAATGVSLGRRVDITG